MLGPKSGRTSATSKPTRLLSKKRLREAWNKSRDASPKAGRPGIDGVTAQSFAANLDFNLTHLTKNLKLGAYGPAPLKAIFIPKENSNKERMICIPCVVDRLVQRAIVAYLASNKKLPIYNRSSFGFIDGLGTTAAIRRSLELRNQYSWCLKADIESFFDSIPRQYLKTRLSQAVGNSSLVPIISKIIDCEIKPNPRNREKLRKQGIKLGVGIRQGMPLSPILANLVLSKFDVKIERSGIEMVRYADDLLLFFRDKEAAFAGHQLVKDVLAQIELSIPEIADGSKTQIFGPRMPIPFLGRVLAYVESSGGYQACVSSKQIDKIKQRIMLDYSFAERSKVDSTFQETVVELWQSVAAYLGIYKDAYNFPRFEQEMRAVARATLSQIFTEIFGPDALSKLASHHKKFLGIDKLTLPEAVNDIET